MLRSRIKQQGIDLTGKKTLIELCSDRLGVHPAEVIKRFKAGNVPDDYINPWEARTISVREMARCQSFDDSFEFLGKRTTTVYSSGKCSSTAISKSSGRSNHASIVDVGMSNPSC